MPMQYIAKTNQAAGGFRLRSARSFRGNRDNAADIPSIGDCVMGHLVCGAAYFSRRLEHTI